MSIARALAEYVAMQDMSDGRPLLPNREESIFPDVISFVDQELERSSQGRETRREGLAYGIVSDILAPRYGGEAMIASVVLDFANRLGFAAKKDLKGEDILIKIGEDENGAPIYGPEYIQIGTNSNGTPIFQIEEVLDQEYRFEKVFSEIVKCFTTLKDDMRTVTAFANMTDETKHINYKISSVQVTDSARILISAGFMRGYITVDVGYTRST